MTVNEKNVSRRLRSEPSFRLFATTAAGLEQVLASELKGIRARQVAQTTRGVAFAGDLDLVYKANLWLRTAHRVLLELSDFEAPTREALYEGVYAVDWEEHLTPDNTLAVDAVSNRSQLTHTQFVSRVVKDAIVDRFRKRRGRRPSVDPQAPDLRLNARLYDDRCTLSIDTSGQQLHRRGYRPGFGVQAPLKETLAAGVLLLSGYDGTQPLVDPMCGSGTLLVEGAMIAKKMPPGLLGRHFGFMGHPSFDRKLWNNMIQDAKITGDTSEEKFLFGSDISEEAIRTTRAAAQGAGVDDAIRVRRAPITDLRPRSKGMVVTNPPYGERLGEMEELVELYRTLGDALKQSCRGMTAHILTGSKFLSGRIGLHPKRKDALWNGSLECRLIHYDLY